MRLLKRFLLLIGGILMLLIIGAIVIAGFFEKQISERLITEINKQLKTELKVENVDLSLLSGFPNAAANLRNVVLAGRKGGALVEADNLSFRFGLFSLFGSNIKIHSIVIDDGALFVHIDKKGRANYDIVKTTDTESTEETESDMSISLTEAQLRNVELIYMDDQNKQTIKLKINNAVAAGQFSTNEFSLNSYADLKSEFIELPDGRYLVGKQLDYDAEVDVNFKDGVYTLKNVNLGIESNRFNVDGVVTTKGKDTDFDLQLLAKDGSIRTMIDLLPESYQDYLADFESSGKFVVDASIQGILNDRKTPDTKVNFQLDNGRITSSLLKHSLKDVTFTANFDNTKSNGAFEIADFKGYFNRELVRSKLLVDNLEDPYIDLTIDGVLPLESVYGLLDSPTITDGDGEIEVKNFRIKGKYAHMINPNKISRVKSSGVIEFDDAALTINKEEMIVDKGLIKLVDNSMIVKNVTIEGAGSDFALDGKFVNFLPVLFSDSLNTKHAELIFQSSLTAKNLDLDRLAKLTETPIDESRVAKSVVDSIHKEDNLKLERFTKLMKGSFAVGLDKFNYNYIEGKDFDGSVKFKNNEVFIKGKTEAMGGAFDLDAKVLFEDRPFLQGKLICDNVDAKEFFRQNEDFGQAVLQSRHVKGDMNAKFAFYAYWAPDGTFLYDDLKVYGDIEIKNGELYNFEMMYDFATFVKLQDLKHIKFTRLHNLMEIRKNRLYIPAMFIQSNALNLTLSGEHRFDNTFNYNVKVNAGQVLMAKFKRYNPKKKPHKAKRNGWFNIYARTYGNLDKFTTKMDKRSVNRNFKRSEARKQKIRKKLEAIFGTAIEDIVEDADAADVAPEIDDSDIPDDPEYIEGFDENGEFEAQEVKAPNQELIEEKEKEYPKRTDTKIPEPELEEEEEFIEFEG